VAAGGGAAQLVRAGAAAGVPRASLDAMPLAVIRLREDIRGWYAVISESLLSRLGDPALSVDGLALALNCSRRQLYNAFSEEPDGVAGYILRRRIEACRQTFDDRRNDRRSITDIAVAFGFSSMAHFSRVFRAHLGVPPSDYRRALLAGGA
jgi:AraC-like DNA-binding protein